jgi:hypothetical protein
MRTTPKLCLLAAALAFLATYAPAAADVPEWSEKQLLPILKTYSANDDGYIFRAYLVEWKGQEAIADDPLALTQNRSDDTIEVNAHASPYPQNKEPYGLLHFYVTRPKKYSATPAPAAGGGGVPNAPFSVPNLQVLKVYSVQDGPHVFRAYVVEWKGQEVIVSDPLAKSSYRVGDLMPTLVMKHAFPRGGEAHGLLHFMVGTPGRRK